MTTPDDAGTRLTSERAWTGRLLAVDRDRVRTPNGTELTLEMVRHPGASAVIPVLSPDLAGGDPTVLLLRQYRYAAEGMLWEVPAGVLEPGEDPLTCAQRELREETGAEADHFEHLTSILTTPGFTDEVIHIFLATGIRTGSASPNRDELIEPQALPLSQALGLIRDGAIRDAKTIVALLFLAGFRLNL